MAKNIMFQGTGSHVGKSVIAAAFCRIFFQDGFKVAPYKSQNMALNSYVTKDGGEMGRAQVVQAEAAGIEPDVNMNPILLKPTGHRSSQVVVLGKAVGNMGAVEYHQNFGEKALPIVEKSLRKLQNENDVIVIEGAGSPAEVNLKARDIVNMRIAKLAPSPVVLVADIDRGGVIASLVGTLELLEEDERDLVKGFIINKFRGDVSLLQPALDFLEEKTGKPVLGVVPYFDFNLPEEDSVAQDFYKARENGNIEIAVIRLPRISNFTDFEVLANESDVKLKYVKLNEEIGQADVIIIPGSKNTIEDTNQLWASGMAEQIKKKQKEGVPVIGICGGYQILGKEISDPSGTESSIQVIDGLTLLDTVTLFETEKATFQSSAIIEGHGKFFNINSSQELEGYEIHMGTTKLGPNAKPLFKINTRGSQAVDIMDGAINEDGNVFGTYLHGIFDNDAWRNHFLNVIRKDKGLTETDSQMEAKKLKEENFDNLAELVRKSVDINKIYEILGLER